MKIKPVWLLWIVLSGALASYFFFIILASEDKSELLIGESTYGHYQIEMSCSSCHTDPFGGPEVLQNACENCHAEELKQGHDSHPMKKFTDPRDAYRLDKIDARYCISCHTEHQKEQTHSMGVTLPDDYCFHCHADVADERESHQNLDFDSCASAGCHNFHDNRALYESFLVKHANQPWLDDMARITAPNHAAMNASKTLNKSVVPIPAKTDSAVIDNWPSTAHGKAAIACNDCHSNGSDQQWLAKPELGQCQQCHQQESQGFVAGKHGMRLSPQLDAILPAISPSESPLEFKTSSHTAHQGCSSCHSVHESKPQFAHVDACLQCHNDEHSLAFTTSPHGKLWNKALNQQLNLEQAVSCATCHMPRIDDNNTGIKIVSNKEQAIDDSGNGKNGAHDSAVIRVEHNQNFYLRPNEKMIRPVCMQCHSLEFSIDALADKLLIKRNFSGQPSQHIPSIDWALKRESR